MLLNLQKNEFPGRVHRLAAPDPKTGGITISIQHFHHIYQDMTALVPRQ